MAKHSLMQTASPVQEFLRAEAPHNFYQHAGLLTEPSCLPPRMHDLVTTLHLRGPTLQS